MRRSTFVSILGAVLLVLVLVFVARHDSASAATALPDPAVDEKLAPQKGRARSL
jgi:hypothetical protein